MAAAWRALVLVIGLSAVACVAQLGRGGSYEEAANQALTLFNYGRLGRPLFRLLEVTPPPSSNFTRTTRLKFRIKETVCLSELRRRQPQECAFKDGGEEQNCTSVFFMRQHFQGLMLNCAPSSVPQQEAFRRKRSAASPEAASSGIDSSKLPPAVRDMYEKAKFDIIANILRNF